MRGAGNSAQRVGRENRPRVFEIGDQWLGQEDGVWYRYWYDTRAGRGYSRSMGTRDLEEAKIALAKLVLGEPPEDPMAQACVQLAAVFSYYMEQRGASQKPAAFAFRTILEYMKIATGGPSSTVADFGLLRQQGFMRWAARRDLKARTIATYLTWAKAALNWAATPHLFIDSRGREREGQLINHAPKVFAAENYVSKITGLPMSKPRHWLPTDAELARFLDFIRGDGLRDSVEPQSHIFRYCIIALCTGARPQAILDLNVSAQVDFTRGLVDLNPPDRRQTKKVRPLIRLCDTLRGWLLYWAEDQPINFRGAVVRSPKGTFSVIAKKAGLPKLTPYTLRHYWATRIKTSGVAVLREQRAAWMGHIDPDHRTTEKWYESFDPDFLEAPMRATDAIIAALNACTTKSLYAPGTVLGSRLTVLQDEAPLPKIVTR